MTQTIILECSKGKRLKRNHSDCSSAMMGKKQKFSKGYSSGFVPDYRHAIETVGETEGFGSSRCADSEDSCTRKRKCISLNADQSNSFNVPVQVISATKMSSSGRKDLEMKLKGELAKVQMLQKKILSTSPAVTAGVAIASSTDVHATNLGLKRGISGRFSSAKQAPPPHPHPHPGNSLTLLMKQCDSLLKNLMLHKYSWVFNIPVDVVKLKLPDYFNIIKHPMDLGTIKKKLQSGSYSSPLAFASDVRLTFTNAMTYNPPGTDVHIMAATLNMIFEKKWKLIGEKLATAEESVKREEKAVKREEKAVKIEPLPLPQKRKAPPMEPAVSMPKKVKRKMPSDAKHELENRLQSLLEVLPDHITDFLRQQNHNANSNKDADKIDIDNFKDDRLFELQKLLDDCFGTKQLVPRAKVEPCKMEILVESVTNNSSIHLCRVNEPADEDVDIGGDDPPIISYPHVEITKDTSPRSSKCSSSSSSSSDSGSSSSESDTGSSSGSESDVKAASPTNPENRRPGIGRDLEKCEATVPIDSKRTISVMNQQKRGASREPVWTNQQEHRAPTEPVSVDADDPREGENATSERHVSPDKLYRAALLRSRFADTILKAREKTLNQGEKKDPEKLRREREELERQKREEKSRLQAEAKAAEEARRQAEADAAAEAKRKRQREREAARQALSQMEKTVEINENSLILKDLEILGTASGEYLSSTDHEMSPDDLQCLNGFNQCGGNPLELLGLFRKDEEEEEEEYEECRRTNLAKNDIEEGEIH